MLVTIDSKFKQNYILMPLITDVTDIADIFKFWLKRIENIRIYKSYKSASFFLNFSIELEE